MQIIIDNLNKELGLSNGRFDAAKQFSKTLELKMETINKRLVALEELPEKLAIATSEVDNLKRTKENQAASIADLRNDIKLKREEYIILEQSKNEATDQIVHWEGAIKTSSEAAVKFEQKAIFEEQTKLKALEELAEYIQAEQDRVNGM